MEGGEELASIVRLFGILESARDQSQHEQLPVLADVDKRLVAAHAEVKRHLFFKKIIEDNLFSTIRLKE